MKYQTEIEIDLPVKRVVELFDNPDNMKKWQPELISFEHISGTPGHTGAKSKLRYKMGKREIEMIETVTKRNLPEEFAGTYEAKNVFNIISNKFTEVEQSKTRWVAYNEFKLTGFMMFFGLLGPGMFKKQTMKFMKQFKSFAESVNN